MATASVPPGWTIEAEAVILEIWRCGDSQCGTFAVEQQWSGTVTRAVRRFHKLAGASVSGGGVVVLDATTFELISLDEVLEIQG